ncbi:MAG: hypothetical protein FIB01_12780 [Gemmatimonadetes bacterium]|nr:hypothetical protein [Gemmatimonadota bacterium]
MPHLSLYTGRDPRRLLEHAASGFLEPRPRAGEAFPSPDYWLILRQGGLRDDLLALAAERGVPGWFDPPIRVFAELPKLLPEPHARAIGDYERVVLVARALRECGGRVFRPDPDAYSDAADRWFGELLGAGITPAALLQAQGAGNHADAFTRARDAELLQAYGRYLHLLDAAGLRDPRARLVDGAAAITAAPHDFATRLGGRRELRIVGLSDPRGGWPQLLAALRDSPALDRIAVYASEPLPFLDALADETTSLDEAQDGPRPERALALLSAPDLPREVEEIAGRVRALLAAGTAPRRIAVVARSARPYTDQVLRALTALGVPATARRRHAYAEVPAVRALLALFRVAAEGWERAGLVELAESPYFRARLDAVVLDHIGYRRRIAGLAAWRQELAARAPRAADRERRLAEDPDDAEAAREYLPPAARVSEALAGFTAFAQLAADLDRPRPLAAWLDWLDTFLEGDAWQLERALYQLPADRYDVIRLDTTAWRAVREILAEWRAAEGRWGSDAPLDARAFHARLRALLSGDAALFTPVRRGVQVLEGLAAAFRSFDHVFLVGMDSGSAPRRMPQSPLIEEAERAGLRAAGLAIDTREDWDAREQELLRNLVLGARTSLTISFARYDEGGAEQLPAELMEELQESCGVLLQELPSGRAFTPGAPLVPDGETAENAERAAHIERARGGGGVTAYNGLIEAEGVREQLAVMLGDTKVWSPTQIEEYAKCPWAYFATRLLRLEQRDDPELELDPRTRGSILHDALRRFYQAAGKRVGGPVFLRAADLPWALPLAEWAIGEALQDAEQELWIGHPALRAQTGDELTRLLVRYVEWEIADNEDACTNARKNVFRWVRTGVIDHERSFDDVVLERDGERVRFRGFIDRVERGVDERGGAAELYAAVDYKTSIYATPAAGKKQGWDDGVVLQVPLYAYALTQLYPGSGTARVEYRTLRDPQRVHVLPLYRYDRVGRVEDGEQRMAYEQALDAVIAHVRAARAGYFGAAPPASCNCTAWCPGRDLCRVPGGPRER